MITPLTPKLLQKKFTFFFIQYKNESEDREKKVKKVTFTKTKK